MEWFKQNWKLVVLVVAVVVAFFGGRSSVPDKPEKVHEIHTETHTEHTVVDEKALSELQEQIKSLKTQLIDIKKRIHREKKETFHDNGVIATREETEDINVDTSVKTVEVKEVEKQVVVVQEKLVDHVIDRIVYKDRTVEVGGPSWFVGPTLTWVPSLPAGQQFNVGITGGKYVGKIPLLGIPTSVALGLSVPTHKPISVPAVTTAVTFGF